MIFINKYSFHGMFLSQLQFFSGLGSFSIQIRIEQGNALWCNFGLLSQKNYKTGCDISLKTLPTCSN